MVFLKGCTKCGGDVILDSDMYGKYIKCLQCGFLKDVVNNDKQIAAEIEAGKQAEAA